MEDKAYTKTDIATRIGTSARRARATMLTMPGVFMIGREPRISPLNFQRWLDSTNRTKKAV